MPLSRRSFISGSAAALGLIALPGHRSLAATAGGPDIVDVEGGDPKAMVAAALAALGGVGKLVKRGDIVVIKPNAALANPAEWGSTTHPQTVVAVAQACLDAGAKHITVLEFPQAKGQKCLDRCGLTAAMAALPDVQVKVLTGAAEEFKTVAIPNGIACKSVDIAKLVLSADVLINIPAAKSHDQTGVSLGLKNAMGLIRDRQAFHTQFDLHQGLADLTRVLKPQLTLVDATRALITNGPAGPGETVTAGRMAAGIHVASVDAYALTLARFHQRQLTPTDVRHIALAGAAGAGEVDIAKLEVKKVRA